MTDVRDFDAAVYLDAPEARAAYLKEAQDSGDPREIFAALRVLFCAIELATLKCKRDARWPVEAGDGA